MAWLKECITLFSQLILLEHITILDWTTFLRIISVSANPRLYTTCLQSVPAFPSHLIVHLLAHLPYLISPSVCTCPVALVLYQTVCCALLLWRSSLLCLLVNDLLPVYAILPAFICPLDFFAFECLTCLLSLIWDHILVFQNSYISCFSFLATATTFVQHYSDCI